MNWNKIKVNEETKEITIPDDWLHIHYYEALNILFRFENSLRVFVYIILKENLKENWNNTNIRDNLTIKQIAKQRQTQDSDYGYLTYDINSPMLYLTSGELIDIIMYDSNWRKFFNKFFKAKKEIIKHKLLEIGAIRNALAHFRPINQEDLDVIKQNVKHTLITVEKTLNAINRITIDVPTNTTDEWYKNINKIKSKNSSINLYQDLEGNWINVKVTFFMKTLHTTYEFDTVRLYDIMNLSSINLLKNFPILQNNIINLNEEIMVYKDSPLVKNINLIFSKKVFSNNSENIVNELMSIFKSIDEEVELLTKDKLAKGKLLNTKSAYYKKEGSWTLESEPFYENIEEYNGVEFWGKKEYNLGDSFITSEHKLPWMPTSISSNEFPF